MPCASASCYAPLRVAACLCPRTVALRHTSTLFETTALPPCGHLICWGRTVVALVQTVRPQGSKLAFLVLRQNKQGYVATIQASEPPG
jgi:hypothetical protein